MPPKISGIDHVHVYVNNWRDAEDWYGTVLGFQRVDALMSWAIKGGPFTMGNRDDTVHLALFERDDHGGSSAIAFGTSGEEFLAWKTHLEAEGLTLRIVDHKLAYSLYFHDPDQNMHEITSYERDFIAEKLLANERRIKNSSPYCQPVESQNEKRSLSMVNPISPESERAETF